MKNFPWLSISILLIAYSTFSWFLTQSLVGWISWTLVLLFTLMQAVFLTTWLMRVRSVARKWLESDVGYFTMILILAISMTMALVWVRVFGYILVLISSEILVRLDLQNAGLNRWQSLFMLTLISLAGLGIGWYAGQHIDLLT